MQSHFTRPRWTVPRRRCTSEPTGFITALATRSEDTAVSGGTLKKSTSTGVISAPPPMPVRPDDDADAEGGDGEERVDGHELSGQDVTMLWGDQVLPKMGDANGGS